MEENKIIFSVSDKMKKYSILTSCVVVIIAIMALVITNTTGKSDTAEQTTVGETRGVEVKVTNIPDNRIYETIIVPATDMPTEKKTEPTTEMTTISAPVSYALPLGTDMGKDFSRGIPVYNDIMADWRTHDGIDFNGAYGDGVKAIADGFIRDIYTDEIMGPTIVIDHGGDVIATYCGVEASEELRKGMHVDKCDKIGILSTIPSESDADYPHLHLEITVDGEIADPLEVMGLYE